MSVIHNDLLLSGDDGYNLTRSLRFRASASAYLSRTPASSGSRTTWTWSDWVKRGQLGSFKTIFTTNDAVNNSTEFFFNTDDTIKFREYASSAGGYTAELYTTQVFRDPSAWYHIVLVWDSNNATSSDRLRLYINGTRVTAFSTANYPSSGRQTFFNSAYATTIGTNSSSSTFDGYRTELNFIDGQALTPSSFGETSSTTGVWQPKRYTGTYGTNGFYLPFTDNSALTSGSNAGLGKDFSGNGNYWNTNNISITSGSTYDSMTDVPTLTSATASNFCVLSPIDKNSSLTVNNGNLGMTSASGNVGVRGSMGVTTGKWYFETTVISAPSGATDNIIGVAKTTWALDYVGNGTTGIGYGGSGTIYGSGGGSAATFGTNDVIGCAFDADAQTITFYKNNTSQGTFSIPSGSPYFPACSVQNSTLACNFGQRPFAYTPPTGYVALNTYNLPTPTIGATASSQANKYMDVSLYTGNGSTNVITNSGGFSPDLVWVKSRSSGALYHALFDTNRGTNNRLFSNTTDSEDTTANTLTSFNSDGFTLGSQTGQNQSGATFVGWQWRGSDSTAVTNTAGSITSTVSANTTSGFSIVTYTGTGANATVGHGLGVAPKFIIVKNRTVGDWQCYHSALGNTQYISLNGTGAAATASQAWNNTSPTSTTFSVGTASSINGSGTATLAYCFAEVAGFSKFGSYTSNGSSDGPFVYTGFKPRWIMFKLSDAVGSWVIQDTARGTYNVISNPLYPNLSNAEGSSTSQVDVLSNGFKLRAASNINENTSTVIYAAFAENPFKYSLAR